VDELRSVSDEQEEENSATENLLDEDAEEAEDSDDTEYDGELTQGRDGDEEADNMSDAMASASINGRKKRGSQDRSFEMDTDNRPSRRPRLDSDKEEEEEKVRLLSEFMSN
jgi:hypothetical protein